MTDENNALVPVNIENENMSLAVFDDYIFDDMVAVREYFPVLRLMTAASEQVKSGEFPTNHYALQEGGALLDVGAEVECCVFAWRPTAMDYTDGLVIAHDPEHPVFKRIREESASNPSCTFGPEYLIWVASQNKFVTFYMGSKSARREAPALRAILKNWQEGNAPLPSVIL